ncbi:hypothetical protein VNO77_34012 [Canavalia gladiata]|uniref:Uncharacterized protein n=1 Tax=Canavalia gladiata TaxID=3824 RepID=A0AAN9KEF0_CANGL
MVTGSRSQNEDFKMEEDNDDHDQKVVNHILRTYGPRSRHTSFYFSVPNCATVVRHHFYEQITAIDQETATHGLEPTETLIKTRSTLVNI